MIEIDSIYSAIDLVKHFGLPLIAIECGVAGGSSSEAFLRSGFEKIYCVDNWGFIENQTGDGNFPNQFHVQTFTEYKRRFSGELKDKVVTLKGLSSVMHKYIPDGSVGFIFIDGGHQYKIVKGDIKNYVPKLVSGGIISFHDYFNEGYGVRQAVEEFAKEQNLIIHTIPAEDLNQASVWIRVR